VRISNTFELQDNTFVDLFGFFTLRDEKSFDFIVPEYLKNGKLSKYKGQVVKLTEIAEKHYGKIIKIEPIGIAESKEMKSINILDFNTQSAVFYSLLNWNNLKKLEGIKLFKFLRSYNPIYIQKNKDWKKQFIETSKAGDYFITLLENEKGSLKQLNGKTCLFVASYNKGFNNGFLVIPIE
jgi:hypothetical protein